MRLPLALVLVTLGGAVGTAARVVVSYALPTQPLVATLAVNVAGAFFLGVLLERLAGRRGSLRLLLGTGFCGGFTTYSLVAFQAAELTRGGGATEAVVYALFTLVLGGLATVGGMLLGALRWRGGQRCG